MTDCGLAYATDLSKVTHAQIAFGERREDFQSRGIRKRGEDVRHHLEASRGRECGFGVSYSIGVNQGHVAPVGALYNLSVI